MAKRVVGIEPTHQPWEGRRLPLHHTRAGRPFRFEPFHTPSYNPGQLAGVGPCAKEAAAPYAMALIERATTMAMVISEMIASTVMSALAQRLNGMTSVGLNAVELVNARYR
jgi:hypothetical protein